MKSPYRTVDEFYGAVRELIAMLKAQGCAAEAERLEALMGAAWTTGSELIGELMLALAGVRGTFRGEIRSRMDACHHFAKHHRRILGLQ